MKKLYFLLSMLMLLAISIPSAWAAQRRQLLNFPNWDWKMEFSTLIPLSWMTMSP